jgi:hypothetical protein
MKQKPGFRVIRTQGADITSGFVAKASDPFATQLTVPTCMSIFIQQQRDKLDMAYRGCS